MKLRNLNGLIRKSEGPPKMTIVTQDGFAVVSLVKSDLMKGLAAVWPDNTAETGLALTQDGILYSEAHGDCFSPGPSTLVVVQDAVDPDQIDIDELLTSHTDTGAANSVSDLDDELLGGDGPPTFDEDDLDGLLG